MGHFQIPNTKMNKNTCVEKFKKCVRRKKVRAAKFPTFEIREIVWCVYTIYVHKYINIREKNCDNHSRGAAVPHVHYWTAGLSTEPPPCVIDPKLLARDPIHQVDLGIKFKLKLKEKEDQETVVIKRAEP